MANQKIRIRLKAYEHRVLDESADKIVETCKADRCSSIQARFRYLLNGLFTR